MRATAAQPGGERTARRPLPPLVATLRLLPGASGRLSVALVALVVLTALLPAAFALASGGVTVIVSHRFSTVRMADLIVVVDDGRIVEKGSHAQLSAAGGLYAELYDLQARAYR